MSNSKRDKASDVLAGNPPWLSTPTSSFSKAFPGIKSVKMTVEEEDMGRAVKDYEFLTGSLPGEYLNCGNPRCYNGGYSVGQTLRYIEAAHLSHFEDRRSCQGYEGSPKGRKRHGRCDRSFTVTVDVVFADGT